MARKATILEKALKRPVTIHSDGSTSRGRLSNRQILRNQSVKVTGKPRKKKSRKNQILDRAIKDSIEATENPRRRK